MLLVLGAVDELELDDDDEEDVLVEELLGAVDELDLDDDDEEDVLVAELFGAVDELELDDDDEEDVLVEELLGAVDELEPDGDDEENVLVEELLAEFVKGSSDCVKLGDLVGCTLPSRSAVASSDSSVFPFLLVTGAAPLETRRFKANGLQICFCMAPKTMNTVWPGTCLPQSHTSPLSVPFLSTFGENNLLPSVLSIRPWPFGRLRIVYTSLALWGRLVIASLPAFFRACRCLLL